MLLHKKRIQGSLMGIGVQNPYAHENLSPLNIQPMTYTDYVNNLILKPEDVNDRQTLIQKAEMDKTNNNQKGGAIDPETAVQTVQAIYQGIKKAADFYQSETGTQIKNFYGKYINPHPNWRSGFSGEKHLIHSSGNTYNFLGPGTQIEKRIARGDPPLDGSRGLDAQAKIHDVDYLNAKTLQDVRMADKRFVENVQKAEANPITKKIITTAMKGKMKAEDLGILDKNYYSQIEIADVEDVPAVEELGGGGLRMDIKKGLIKPPKKKLKKVRKMGKYPDSALRQKLLKQYGKSKNKLIKKIK